MWELGCTDEKGKRGKEKIKGNGAKGQKAKNNREEGKKSFVTRFLCK